LSYLEILGLEPGVFRDHGQALREDFVLVVESEDVVRPPGSLQDAVGTAFAFHGPADTEKRGEDSPCLASAPARGAQD